MLKQLGGSGWQGDLASLILGFCMVFGFAPFGYWPLCLVAYSAAIVLIHSLTPKAALRRSIIFHFGWFLAGASWVFVSIHRFGNANIPLAGIMTIFFVFVYALVLATALWLSHRYFRHRLAIYCFVAIPSLLMVAELLRSVLFTGFPWLYLGYIYTDSIMANYAPLVGVYGLTWLSFLLAGALAFTVIEKRISKRTLTCVFLIFVVAAGSENLSGLKEKKTSLSVSLIQANIPQEKKWLPEELIPTIQLYERLTKKEWGRDIILWPEAALPVLQHKVTAFLNRLAKEADKMGSHLVLGIPAYDFDKRAYFNRLISIGTAENTYDKQHLVPFGEYVPFESWLRGIIEFFNLPMSNFIEGSDEQALFRLGNLNVTPAICYEIAFPGLVRSMVKKDEEQLSDLIITVSNDAWFGDSLGPKQHFQMARMRAQELGRPILRAANTGITGVINHRGEVTHQIPAFTLGTLQGEVNLVEGETIYLRWGFWLPFAIILAGLGILGFYFFVDRKAQETKVLSG